MALRVEDIDLAADRELVERWQSGEQGAFDDLYRRYFDRLRAHCYRRVGDRHVAEELAQEAFVKALQALPRFAGERRFYPWVSVIASRLCVDHHRRMGRVRPSDEVDPGSVDGDHGARLAFLADVDNLDRALRRLGPRHAEVLELRERQGMSYAEIAEHLDVPQSTVEALLFRARKALRREFLAVSGEGKLAGLPVIGWLLRRTLSARDRVAEALPTLSQLTAPAAAGAAAVALSVASLGGGTADLPVRAAAAPTPALGAVTTSAPAVQVPVPAPPRVSPAPGTTAPRGPVANDTAAPGVSYLPPQAAREETDAMPVNAALDGVIGGGVDPAEVAGWLGSLQEDPE